MKRSLFIPTVTILVFFCVPAFAGMSIKEICISERGKPTGIILYSNFKNPSGEDISIFANVSGRGALEWLKIHLKKSVLRLETGGQLHIEKLESPFSIKFDGFGRMIELDGTDFIFGKQSERLERIGPLIISYDPSEPKITGISGIGLRYDSLGRKVNSIGDIRFTFDDSGIRLIRAGHLDFSYENSGLKLTGIGSMRIEYNALGLKISKVKGSIPGVMLIMTGEKEPCREFPF